MAKRPRFDPVPSPYLVPFDGSFRVKDAPTKPSKRDRNDLENEAKLAITTQRLAKLQSRLMAGDRHSVLVVLQAMDAAGKDGTLRTVMSGVNTAGVDVHSFKAPNDQELDHDFLWRIWTALPQRGRIGIFNRSHYEEVLVVRVHPEYLTRQRLPEEAGDHERLWAERYESIRDMERHLARNGTTILKFWLNVSKQEQKARFLDRVKDPEANWKFSAGDIKERRYWKQYMQYYECALNETSRPCAPWYAIPADDKKHMRAAVSEILVQTLERLNPKYPEPTPEARAEMLEAAHELERE